MKWAHVAGFFDGEGNLHRIRKRSTVHLRFDNTSRVMLVRIQQFLGCGTVSNRGRQKPHHKDRYRLTISDHVKVAWILEKMMPYLIVKRKAAKKMLRYINGRKWRVRRRARPF